MGVPRQIMVPALSTVVMLAILIGLGTWQVERLKWKTGLLDAIAAAEQAPAIPLTDTPAQFTKVTTQGTFQPEFAALYGAEVRDTPAGPILGGQLIEPLLRPGQPALLVDRGWVADAERDAAARAPATSVIGYARDADRPGWFSAVDDVEGRRFYTLDPVTIGHALGVGPVAPFTLVALGPPIGPGGGLPDPAQTLPRPPNNHFQYALTWYGFAVTLLIIFSLYVRSVTSHPTGRGSLPSRSSDAAGLPP